MPKDPLCPLGFHPQVRWPTRCKRCFREYKEHSTKKEEPLERVSFLTAKSQETKDNGESGISTIEKKDYSSPYSSISSAALNRLTKIHVEDSSKKLGFAGADTRLAPPEFGSPLRRNTTDLSQFLESELTETSPEVFTHHLSPNDSSVTIRLRKSSSFTEESTSGGDADRSRSPSPTPRSKTPTPIPTFKLTDSTTKPTTNEQPSLRNGDRKSSTGSLDLAREDVTLSSVSPVVKKKTRKKRLLIKGVQEVIPEPHLSSDGSESPADADDNSSPDVAFIIQVKSTRQKRKGDDDETMSVTTTATDTTDTTLIDVNEFGNSSGLSLWEYDELKAELTRLKEKCDKLEKEKADILSRRVSSLEAPKTQSTEYLKLQQKVNQLSTTNEDLKDEQKHMETRIRELEKELSARPTGDFFQRCISELRSKLANSDAEIEKLHEEKRETEQQMNEMQDEFEEMQDSFHEDKSEEYAALKKDLDDSNKSCRVLQFKLRKAEKRVDVVEAEKKELENTIEKTKNISKILQLEEELAKSKAENENLLRESFKYKKNDPQLSPRLGGKKKSPVLTKAPSGEFVDPPIPSDVDPGQLLHDLQSTLERESDMREQLKFAEEEVSNLRQKMSRIEDENESLLIQIKKMSTMGKPRHDTLSKGKGLLPISAALSVASALTNSTETLDASELKLQFELNEQESKILRRKVEDLEKMNNQLTKDLENSREKLEVAKKNDSCVVTKSKNVEEVSILRRKIIEKEREIERLEAELQTTKTKSKMSRSKSVEVEESKAEARRLHDELSKLKFESSAQTKTFEEEISRVKGEMLTGEHRVEQLNESNKTLLAHVEKFKRDIGTMKEHYEAIQDDFVLKNSNLIDDKEKLQMNLSSMKIETEMIEKELKALRETFNARHDTWIKEKLVLQERVSELEVKSKSSNIPGENLQLKKLVKNQTVELENIHKEIETYKDQVVFVQKENDELRKQLEDFEKLSQVQIRSISNEPTLKSDKEIKAFRERLQSEEKSHKNEMAQMKLRQDQELAAKSEDISSMQSQLSRAKRERDTFRQMVDSAQRAIAELKSKDSFHRKESISGLEEAAEGARAAVNTLQERVQSLEDDLSESRRETARSKTELATEHSTWEMKLGQMQQKINELEEDRLLGSGRARAAGQRTRLELAWQKERDEQQRRLKEATTLARDLKTTLQEIERERDREKIENRRRLEQMKSALEEEQEELRRKVGESQSDLLELRDAHAKLRTANEKLRRDREKLEKEREIILKKELEARKLGTEREKLLDDLTQRLGISASANDIRNVVQNMKLVKSDVSGPGEASLQSTKEKRRSGFRRVASAEGADTLPSQSLTVSSSAYGKEHYGVAGAVGRAAMKYAGQAPGSTLTLPSNGRMSRSESTEGNNNRGMSSEKGGMPQGNVIRKSLSLEQSVFMPDEQRIWKGEAEAGSGSSLKSMNSFDSRGSSVDRLSTVSSKSEKPKSKSLVSKMKKLVKSKSIEESHTAQTLVRVGLDTAGVELRTTTTTEPNSGSITSITSEHDKELPGKIKLKDKVKGMFRRSSRSPSAERTNPSASLPTPEPPSRPSRESTPKKDTTSASLQRPLMPIEAPSTQRPLMPTQSLLAPQPRRFN